MGTTLTIEAGGERFCLNGRRTFLLGASYYAGLGAPEDFIEDDLTDLKRAGVNWIRVWATWGAFGQDVSAFDEDGDERPGHWEKLLWLCDFAEKLTIVVDVTLSRGGGVAGGPVLGSDEAHLNAAGILAEGLKGRRNVSIDLANERNVRDERHVPIPFVRRLRDRIKQIDPDRLVTASHAGDVEPDRLYEYLTAARVDFLTPHRPRNDRSPRETEQKTRTLRSRMARLGKVVPILYQEPFRRGFGEWQPAGEDFLADLRGAVAGGAAGWCLHNGHSFNAPHGRPRRSFDMRSGEGRLVDQLEDEERAVLWKMKQIVRGE
jgi:hypothetical protein